MKKSGFSAIVTKNTQVLIVGSLPGDVSIKAQEYYANKNNKFWEIVLSYLDPSLSALAIKEMSYQKKCQLLLEHKIGLWDVYAAADRIASLDTNIKNAELNKFDTLFQTTQIKAIIANGRKAEQGLRKIGLPDKILIIGCNSTSPTNTYYNYEQKRAEWHRALAQALEN